MKMIAALKPNSVGQPLDASLKGWLYPVYTNSQTGLAFSILLAMCYR
jgi:hypothetical protein